MRTGSHLHVWRIGLLVACILPFSASSCTPPAFCQTIFHDDFQSLTGWKAVTSHGDASKLVLVEGEGMRGRAMVMDFSFLGHMGSAAAEKKLAFPLPDNYRISFDIRGDAPVNNFIIRLMDSLDNVWVVMRSNYEFPRTWTKFTIRKDQIQYGWGPSGRHELHTLDRIMLMIDVVEGGKGKVWIDNLAVERLDDRGNVGPRAIASSAVKGWEPRVSQDGRSISGWRTSGRSETQTLTIDFGEKGVLGGLVIDWDSSDYATAFDVLLSDDGNHWSTAYAVTNGCGVRNNIFLANGEGRLLRLALKKSSAGNGYALARMELRGPEFSFSINDFFGALAAEAPRGFYPKYLVQQQSYWTVVGAPRDTREALINEQGMIETDKIGFSLEPFLYLSDGLVTWNDVTITQSLEKDYLPIPSVHWDYRGAMSLTVTALADGPEGGSVLFVRYMLENKLPTPTRGKLFVAIRPFQVNPPWQTFTIVGGAARVDSIRCGDAVTVNGKEVIPITRPTAVGAAEFDQGQITEYLKRGRVPSSKRIRDHFGYASGALEYEFSLGTGERKDVVIAVPFHHDHPALMPNLDDREAVASYDRAFGETASSWESKLNNVNITLPPAAQSVANTIRSNLAFILINADGPGLQPGSRSYERSWLRDGALTSAALLEMGIAGEVKRYLDWYAGYQYPNGAIPCIVEARGPEPTPEHDSHGEFIYAVMQYFRFTHDTTWLRGKWPTIQKTVRYIQSLRAQRMTITYRNGTPEQRACYGLVPESISHEGYCPKPMHSYWDDFFILRGLKDAADMAGVLGESGQGKEFAAERDSFRNDLYASMRLAMQNKNIKFIPGCVELGDFSGLSTTVAIMPCDELGYLPEPQLTYTFDQSYRMFLERKNNTVAWDAYLPYEARFIGAYVYLGREERAIDILQFLMRDRRPAAWNGWGEVVWKDYDAPRSIGDMPHSWAASDFIRSVRSMFVYEREIDDALVVGAGLPEEWVNDSAGVTVSNLPTYFGDLSYSMKRSGNQVVVNLSGDVAIPRGKIIVVAPSLAPPASVTGGGRRGADPREVIVDRLPARLQLHY